MKTLSVLAVLITGLTFLGCHKDDDGARSMPVATDNPLISEIDKSIDDNFKSYIENTKHIGLSIAVIEGENTNFYNYGETHKGNKTLPSESALYEIGSNTKTFTAAVATRLILDNSISVDTPINDLLPMDFPLISYQGQKVKLKHLLDHTSGLPRVPNDMHLYNDFDISNPYGNYNYEKLLNFLKEYQLERSPGSEYEYSNLGYLLLSTIILYQSDVPIANHIESFITNPLEMNNTHMEMNGIVDSNVNVMGAYNEDGKEGSYWNYSIWDGMGGLYSNLIDLEKYARAHFKSYSVNAKLKEAIALTMTETYSNELFGVGRAWHIVQSNGKVIINHAGGTGGFSSVILIEPQEEKAIILLANNANVAGLLQDICLSFFKELIQ